jgi:hypothetical protein
VVFQLKNTDAKLLLAHPDLIKNAIAAAQQANIPKERIFLFSETYQAPFDGIRDWRDMIGDEKDGEKWQWKKLSPEESESQVATVNYFSGLALQVKGSAQLLTKAY